MLTNSQHDRICIFIYTEEGKLKTARFVCHFLFLCLTTAQEDANGVTNEEVK